MQDKVQCFKADKNSFSLLAELFPNDFNNRFHQFLKKEIDIYAITYQNKVVGRIIANYTNQHLNNETTPGIRTCLSHFILLKKYRNRGFGSLLLQYALDDLKANAYREFTVGVEDKNVIAKHIYTKNGFTKVINYGIEPCEYTLYLKQ